MKRLTANVFVMSIAVLLLASGSLRAQYTWNGSADTNWQNSANWDESGYPGNWDNVTLPDIDPTAVNQPDLKGFWKQNTALTFERAGWTISDTVGGGGVSVRNTRIVSRGAGVNEIAANLRFDEDGGDFRVESGNTLVVSGLFSVNMWSGSLFLDFTDEAGGTGPAGKTVLLDVFDTANPPSGGGAYWNVNVGTGTVIYGDQARHSNLTVSNDATAYFGDGILAGLNTVFGDNSTLAVGGDGEYGGSEIDTISFQKLRNWGGQDFGINMNGSSTLAVDFSSAAADRIEINSVSGETVHFNMGATTNLALDGVCAAGTTHTLIDHVGAGSFYFGNNGTFGSVLLNGELVDPSADPRLDLSYAGGSLDVTFNEAIIPEPSAVVLFAVGALAMLYRRR